MEEDGQQQTSGQPSTATATSDVRESDLQGQEGVGRCYYTQLPRLVKVSSASTCNQSGVEGVKPKVVFREDLLVQFPNTHIAKRSYKGVREEKRRECQYLPLVIPDILGVAFTNWRRSLAACSGPAVFILAAFSHIG